MKLKLVWQGELNSLIFKISKKYEQKACANEYLQAKFVAVRRRYRAMPTTLSK